MKQYLGNLTIYFRLWALVFISAFSFQTAGAQDSRGTDFWICVPGNLSTVETQLFITSSTNSTVTVDAPGLSFNQVVNVPAGTLQTVTLPSSAQIQTQFTVENKGIHITATSEVTAYLMNAVNATTDAYLAFPTDALGTEYYVLGYNKDAGFSNPTQLTVVAAQNNTTVTITSSVSGGGFTAGVPSNIVLQQGQTYQLRSTATNADYTGSRIVSDKPVGVFGGAQCTNISGNLRACDHLVEQLPPVSAWGRSFVTVPLATRLAGDVFRFLAQTNGTQVSVNGSVVANLNAGQFHEMILSSTSYNRITSNNPILVGQYCRSSEADGVTSDPFFSLVPPDEQFLNSYIISAGTLNIPTNFLNITSPTANIATVMVDGGVVNPGLWNAIPGTSYSGAKVPVSSGIHTVTSVLPIGLLVYGYGSFDSYGYLGGQSFSAVATVTTVTLTPETGGAAVGTNQCFTALVRDQFGNPVSGVRVDFTVTGVNPQVSFAFTDGSGNAQFCYTGNNAGQDNIVASVGAISDNSTFNWTAVTQGTIYYSKAAGDLHNVLTWGLNPDGSGPEPSDFNDSTFQLANRPGIYTMTGDWTINGGTLNIPAASQLQINGHTLSLTTVEGPGTISGSTTSNLNAIGSNGGNLLLNFTPSARMLNNFTVNRTGTGSAVTLGNALDVLNVLTLTTGTLNTGGMLTLKSSAANTARVAPISAATISGDVTVERFIPARRAWRILSAPVGGIIEAAVGSASLTHSQETAQGTFVTSGGGSRPASYGTATFSLNAARTAMTFTATIFNIDVTGTQTPGDNNDNLTAAHIHVGAPPGVNAPVRWGFFGSPDNDNNPKQMVMTPFASGVGGTFTSTWDLPEGNAGTTLTSNLPEILAGRSYINFHTVQFGGGEVRGQIYLVGESTQTVNQAWQEGSVLGLSGNPNPNPGFGTHITGGPVFGSTANGFDQNPGSQTSLKSYVGNTWQAHPNTNATPVGLGAFMTYIRGDRGISIGGPDVPPTNTVLRAKGPLKIGDQTFQVAPTGFTAIGNPFASPIDFATITRSGVQNNFYLWDPKMGGTFGQGAYVLLSFNGSTYDVTPASVSPESQYIQSGQGFLVRPEVNGTPGSIVIKESDKSATPAMDVFRVTNGGRSLHRTENLRVTLLDKKSEKSTVLDEVLMSYSTQYSNNLDILDAVKADNVNENLAIETSGTSYMVERREVIEEGDIIQLKLWNTQPKEYMFEITPSNFMSGNLQAVLEDKFLRTETPVDLNAVTTVPFTITSDPASSRADRFRLIFGPSTKEEKIEKAYLTAYPNPVNGNNLNLALNNYETGTYQVVLINSAGQVVFRRSLQHGGKTITHGLQLSRKLVKGVYQLQVTDKEGKSSTISISSN